MSCEQATIPVRRFPTPCNASKAEENNAFYHAGLGIMLLQPHTRQDPPWTFRVQEGKKAIENSRERNRVGRVLSEGGAVYHQLFGPDGPDGLP